VKWIGYEADHSHPPGSKIKNAQGYTFTHSHPFNKWYFIKHTVVSKIPMEQCKTSDYTSVTHTDTLSFK